VPCGDVSHGFAELESTAPTRCRRLFGGTRCAGVFLLFVPRVDEGPAGRAAAVLRSDLPVRFPEHGFEFTEPGEAKGMGLAHAEDLLFHVLSSRVHRPRLRRSLPSRQRSKCSGKFMCMSSRRWRPRGKC
jgi:hypothetical protein